MLSSLSSTKKLTESSGSRRVTYMDSTSSTLPPLFRHTGSTQLSVSQTHRLPSCSLYSGDNSDSPFKSYTPYHYEFEEPFCLILTALVHRQKYYSLVPYLLDGDNGPTTRLLLLFLEWHSFKKGFQAMSPVKQVTANSRRRNLRNCLPLPWSGLLL